VWILPVAAQDAANPKAGPPPAALAGPKLPRAVVAALAEQRRKIGRELRGGADSYYIVMLGEVIDRPREPTLLDELAGPLTGLALMWDVMVFPLAVITGEEGILVSSHLPARRSNIERIYKHEFRVVHTKLATIETVYEHTAALVGRPPAPNEQRYRGWAFVGVATTEEAAQKARTAAEEKLAGPEPPQLTEAQIEEGFRMLDALKKGEPAAQPPAGQKGNAKPGALKQPPAKQPLAKQPAKAKAHEAQSPAKKVAPQPAPGGVSAELLERMRERLEMGDPEQAEKLRELMRRDFFGPRPQ